MNVVQGGRLFARTESIEADSTSAILANGKGYAGGFNP